MEKEQLSDAIGNINEKHIKETLEYTAKKRNRVLKTVLAFAAVLVLTIAAVFIIPHLLPGHTSPDTLPDDVTSNASQNEAEPDVSDPEKDNEQTQDPTKNDPDVVPIGYAVAEAEYPEIKDNLISWTMTKEDTMHYSREDGKTDSLEYTRAVLNAFLSDTKENAVFSPLSLYFSLASLAEMSGGETRDQILDLLGEQDIESLRKTARAVWLNVYFNGKPYKMDSEDTEYVIPSNSFWLNSNAAVTGDSSVAEKLKTDYFTSFYKGDPLDDGFQNAYRAWLNDHTGGLLKDAVENMSFSPYDVFTLVNTLYLKLTWYDPFDEENNKEDTFYGLNGKTLATYMNQTRYGGQYYKGSCFSSAYLPTHTNAAVVFILPDQGTTLEEIIKNESYMEYFENRWGSSIYTPPEGYDLYEIHFSVPKFNITSSYDLQPYLISLGVTNAFDAKKADIPFIKSTNGENLFITNAKQDVTVDVNEKGISAAAITRMGGGFGDPVFYKVEMNLNRPFLMLVISECNTPLFAAAINTVE